MLSVVCQLSGCQWLPEVCEINKLSASFLVVQPPYQSTGKKPLIPTLKMNQLLQDSPWHCSVQCKFDCFFYIYIYILTHSKTLLKLFTNFTSCLSMSPTRHKLCRLIDWFEYLLIRMIYDSEPLSGLFNCKWAINTEWLSCLVTSFWTYMYIVVILGTVNVCCSAKRFSDPYYLI